MPKGIRKYSDEKFIEAVANSKSYRQVMEYLGIKPDRRSGRNISNRIEMLGLETNHFVNNATRGKDYKSSEAVRNTTRKIRWSNEEVFCEKSSVHQGIRIRKRLLDLGWEYKCSECGMVDEWNGRKLTLQLDHINGNSIDNRFENLRFLCPNCHSQTETFGIKNASFFPKEQYYCSICGKEVSYGYSRCRNCANKEIGKMNLDKNTKINWPPTEELLKMLEDEPFTSVAKKLGVSDNAIRKRLKNHIGSFPKGKRGPRPRSKT